MEIFSELQNGKWGIGLKLQKKNAFSRSFFKKFENKEYNDQYLMQMACFLDQVNSLTKDCFIEGFKKFDLLLASERFLFKERMVALLEKQEILMEYALEKIFLSQRRDLLGPCKLKDFQSYLKFFPLLEAKQSQTMVDVLSDMRSILMLRAFGSEKKMSEAHAEVKEKEINYLKLKKLNLKPKPCDFVKLWRLAKLSSLEVMFGDCKLESQRAKKVVSFFSKLDAFNREIALILNDETDDRYDFAKLRSPNKKFVVFLEKVESFTDLQLLKDCFKDDLLLEFGLTEGAVRLFLQESERLKENSKFCSLLSLLSRPFLSRYEELLAETDVNFGLLNL